MSTLTYKDYLVKVYTGFTVMLCLATVGALTPTLVPISPVYYTIAGLMTLVTVLSTCYCQFTNQYSLSAGFAYTTSYLMGLATYPLIHKYNLYDDTIVPMALSGTTMIFVSTTAYVYFFNPFKENRQYVRYGIQVLTTYLTFSIMFSIANVFFFRSELLELGEVYVALVVFIFFVAFDTGSLIERCRNGEVTKDNYILDSLSLFLDFANIFVRLLRVLSHIKSSGSKKRD